MMIQRMTLTLAEASVISGVSLDRLGQICRAGLIGFKEGRQWVIGVDELEAYFASQREARQAEAGRAIS